MDVPHIKSLIENTIRRMSLGFDAIAVAQEEGHLVFQVRSRDSGALIGTGGETLRAFNTLVKRMTEKKYHSHEEPFLVDVNGYYQKKIRHLKQQARLLADRARTFKSNVEMSPMNPYERMVVHALFTDDPEIFTESSGEGKTRHVTICYRARNLELTEKNDSDLLK